MGKDKRYTTVKNLISGGFINSFQDIFETIPKSVVARDLGMNNVRISKLMNNVDGFVFKDIFRLAALLEVDKKILTILVCDQFDKSKKGKK
jgi:hypothetical protein